MALDDHVGVNRDSQVEDFGIEQGDPADDHTFRFQPFDPSPAGGVGQAYPFPQFRHGIAGIFLEGSENFQVVFVKVYGGGHGKLISYLVARKGDLYPNVRHSPPL